MEGIMKDLASFSLFFPLSQSFYAHQKGIEDSQSFNEPTGRTTIGRFASLANLPHFLILENRKNGSKLWPIFSSKQVAFFLCHGFRRYGRSAFYS
jgi:hypothetical protein